MKLSKPTLFLFVFIIVQLPAFHAHALTWTATNSGTLAWEDIAASNDGETVVALLSNDDILVSTSSGNSWVTYTPSSTVGVGAFGKVAISADGSTIAATAGVTGSVLLLSTTTGESWTETFPTGTTTTKWLWDVDMSDDGSVIVTAFGSYGSGGNVYVSTSSGSTWIERRPTTTGKWEAVTISSDGSKIVVADTGLGFCDGYIYTSIDYGVTWTQRHVDNCWWEISSSADGSKIFAIDLNDEDHSSLDGGVTWNTVAIPGLSGLSGIANSANGERLVVVDLNEGEAYTSTTSGATWMREPGASGIWWDLYNTSSADGLVVYAFEGGGAIWKGVAESPVISGVSTSTSDTSNTISWSTDITSATLINYGVTTSYGLSVDGMGTTTHTAAISGLDTCTKYYYQIQATDNNYDQVGTTTAATFTTSGACFGSNSTQIAQDITDGQISVSGGVPTSTDTVSFNVEYSIVSGGASITFASGTDLTRADSGTMNFLDVFVEDITSAIQSAYVGDIAGAVSVGLTNLNLSFSQNATITIPVSTSYNGQTLNVYSQNEGESNWNLETTCLISAGKCVFLANHATTFSAGDEPETSPSSSGGSGTRAKKETPAEESEVLAFTPQQEMMLRIIAILQQIVEFQKELLEKMKG